MSDHINSGNIMFVPDDIIRLILYQYDKKYWYSLKFANKRLCLLVGSINVKAALFGSVREGFTNIFMEFFKDTVIHLNLHVEVYEIAVCNGHLDVVKYLHKKHEGIFAYLFQNKRKPIIM